MANVSDKTTYIYGLTDPRTNELRYVGKTVLKPERRLQLHISFAKDESKTSRSYRWFRSLTRENVKPEIFVIQEIPPLGDWTEAEQFWIAYYRFIGCRLCNVTDGGEGHSGFVPTADTIAKIKAHRQSDEHRERVSKQTTELWRAKRSEIIIAQNAGKDSSWREKQSIAKKKQWENPDNNMAIAIRKRRKLTDEDVSEIRKSLLDGATQASIALRFDIKGSTVSMINSGRRRPIK